MIAVAREDKLWPRPFGGRARFWTVADRMRLPAVARRFRRGRGWAILWAHGIGADAAAPLEHYPRDIAVSVFRAQMEHLLSEGYEFVTMSEGLKRVQAGEPLDRVATVTFDDGFRTVLDRAYPVMVELGVKGCLYVASDYIGTQRLLWTDMIDLVCLGRRGARTLQLWFPEGCRTFPLHDRASTLKSSKAIKDAFRSVPDSVRREYFVQIEAAFTELEVVSEEFRFASWEQLRGADPAVLEIGNHTRSHPNLTNVEDAESLRLEIEGARRLIEGRLEREVRHFCYPAGSYDDRVVAQVERSGHTSAVTIEYGLNEPGGSVFKLKRFGLPASVSHFKARLSGFEGAILRWRRAVGF